MTTTTATRSSSVPGWAARAARLIPLVTLPSGLWRIALVIGLPIMDYGNQMHTPERIYIVSLSVVQESAALLCLGLVQPWGEVVPGWLPFIGGTRVRPMAAVVPALTGAAILCVLWTVATARMPFVGFYDSGDPAGFRGNPGIIGIQSGFTSGITDALGGGLAEVAVRITLFDGDNAAGDFDSNDNTLTLNGYTLGNWSNVSAQTTNASGTVAG